MARSIVPLSFGVVLFAATTISAQMPKSEFTFTLTTPLHLLYLEHDAVRSELKLNKEQIQKVTALQKSWVDASKTVDLERGLSSVEGSNIALQTRKKLDEFLTVAEMKRLDQVILRHREKEYGRPAVLCMIAADLKLSSEQRERIEVLRRKRAETILEQLTSGERSNAIRRDVHEANTEFIEAVEKLLTREQQTRLKELFGEPFEPDLKLRDPESITFSRHSDRSVYLDQLWGRYGLEAEIINNGSVHKDLKLTDDQIRKAKEFNVEWWTRYESERKGGATEVDAVRLLNDFVTGHLGGFLTKEQRGRFAQIATQYRMNVAGESAALGHPDAWMRLDAERTERIKQGEKPLLVIDPKKLAEFRESLGPKFEGELTIVSPLKVRQPVTLSKPNVVLPLVGTNRLTLARFMLENSRRYRLDEDQVARLKAIDEDLPKLRQLLHRELSQLPPSTDAGTARSIVPEAKAVEHFRKSIFEQCLDVLDKKQQSLWGAELQRARGSVIDY